MHFQYFVNYMGFQAMRRWKQQILVQRGILSSFNTFFRTLNGSFSTVSRSCDTEVFPPYRVVFFGTDQISLETFSLLHRASLQHAPLISYLSLVCPADKPRSTGRSAHMDNFCPTKQYALQHNMTVQQPVNIDFKLTGFDLDFGSTDEMYDLGVVVSFGYFIPQRIVRRFRYGMINMHPSLLPRYRGSSPIQYALLNGDSHTGISVLTITDQMDNGRILLQRTLPRPLLISDTFASLSKDLAIIGAQSIMFCVENLKQLLPPHSSVDTQTTAESSHVFPMARKIRPEQQYVNFEKQTAIEVYRLWQALTGTVFAPAAKLGTRRLIFLKFVPLEPRPEDLSMRPGQVVWDAHLKLLRVRCCDPSGDLKLSGDRTNSTHEHGWLSSQSRYVIGCTDLLLATKDPITASDFANSNKLRAVGAFLQLSSL